MVGVNEQAAMRRYMYCRDICSEGILSIPTEVGCEGHVVETDETSLKKKSKYNRSRHFPTTGFSAVWTEPPNDGLGW
jgi:hypothetical protein